MLRWRQSLSIRYPGVRINRFVSGRVNRRAPETIFCLCWMFIPAWFRVSLRGSSVTLCWMTATHRWVLGAEVAPASANYNVICYCPGRITGCYPDFFGSVIRTSRRHTETFFQPMARAYIRFGRASQRYRSRMKLLLWFDIPLSTPAVISSALRMVPSGL